MLAAIFCSSSVFIACENNEATSDNTATFKTKMTDAPGDYEELMVEIVGIEAYLENSGWVQLSNEAQMVSVLDLTNGAETVLSYNTNVAAGTYSKLKLIFGDQNTLVVHEEASGEGSGFSFDQKSTHDLSFNSQNEVIVEINQELEAGGEAEILLDFQVFQSIKEAGEKYVLDPTIKVIEDAETGISGSVEGEAHAHVMLTNGEDTIDTYTDARGEFLLRGAELGVYQLIVDPMDDVENSEMNDGKTISNVVVVTGQISSVGEIKF